jgi:hypothetical protein
MVHFELGPNPFDNHRGESGQLDDGVDEPVASNYLGRHAGFLWYIVLVAAVPVDLGQKRLEERPASLSSLRVPRNVFTGIVGFEGQSARDLKFYREHLLNWYVQHKAYERPEGAWTAMYVLPNFIGSLREFFVYSQGWPSNQQYWACDSEVPSRTDTPEAIRKNLCIQALLAIMRNAISIEGVPPFAIPDTSAFESFTVLSFDGGIELRPEIVKLSRNDGWTAVYERQPAWKPANEFTSDTIDGHVHLVCDIGGNVTLREPLQLSITPEWLIVRRETTQGSEYEKYSSRRIIADGRKPGDAK